MSDRRSVDHTRRQRNAFVRMFSSAVGNQALLSATSLVVSLVPVTILSLQSQSDMATASGLLGNLGLSSLRVIVALGITLCLNIIMKVRRNISIKIEYLMYV